MVATAPYPRCMAQQQSRSPGRGKPSPEVFRRRRIVVAVALLVVLALLVWAVVSVVGLFTGSSDQAGPPAAATSSSAAPTSPAGTSASESASGSAGASAAASSGGSSAAEAAANGCPSGDIEVSAATDQGTYGAAEKPVLEMKITNTGSKDCTVNVGTSQQEFNIVSGSDRIFSTTDCRKDPSDSRMTLKAGASESARFTWDRLRSAPGCKNVETKPRPGTYTFAAKLGDVESGEVNFSLK